MSFTESLDEIIERNENGLLSLAPGWVRVRFSDVCTILNGYPFPSEGFNSTQGTPLLRIRDVLRGTTDTLFRGDYDRLFLVERGDLLVGMDGDFNLGVWEGSAALLNQRVCRLSSAEAFYAKRLLKYVLPGYLAAIHASTSSTTVKHLSSRTLGEVALPLPPRRHQDLLCDGIESAMTRLDAALEGLRRVKANLKRYRASVLKAAVEGRLVPTEAELAKGARRAYESASDLLVRILKERRRNWEARELAKMKAKGTSPSSEAWKAKYREPAAPDTSNLPVLPEGWCWATVEMVGDVLLGRQRAPQYLTGRFEKPYLRVANIKDDRIDVSDIESMDFDQEHFHKYRLAPGDILVSEGQSPHLVGQSAIYRGEGPVGLCFQKTLHRFRPVAGGPSAEFAQLVFRSHVKSGVFQRVASITTNIAHLTLEKFEAAPFPLPPVPEQERIATEVARILSDGDAVEAAVSANAERIVRLRQSILKWAFEGKLVDQDPNDEPAAVLFDRIRQERLATTDETKRPTHVPARKTA